MMLTIMIILLAWDDEGITLKLHSHGRLLPRCLARNLQWEGVFRGVKPKLNSLYLELERFFCPKLGEESLHLDLVHFFAQS